MIVILNFLIKSWFFLKSKFESGFWLNIIHVWLCPASSFVFCFFCSSEFPFLIWYTNIVKKKRFTQRHPHRNVTLNRPSLQKKKNGLKKTISIVVFFIIRVYFVLSIFFFRLVCVSYLWLCQINLNLVRVPILSYLGVCVWQFHTVCFMFSLKVS